jgi:hypothetical protein
VHAPDASPLAAPTGSQTSQGILGQPIQCTILVILHQLPIPTGGLESLEPRTELGAFRRIQLLNRSFESLEIAHSSTLE